MMGDWLTAAAVADSDTQTRYHHIDQLDLSRCCRENRLHYTR